MFQNITEVSIVRCDGEIVEIPLTNLAVALVVNEFLPELVHTEFIEEVQERLFTTHERAKYAADIVRSRLESDYSHIQIVGDHQRFTVEYSKFVLLSVYIDAVDFPVIYEGFTKFEECMLEALGINDEQQYVLSSLMRTLYAR